MDLCDPCQALEQEQLWRFAMKEDNFPLSKYELTKLADKHAPVKSCTVTIHPESPWFNEDIRAAKRQRRKLERQYRKTKLEVHRQIHNQQCNELASLIEAAKCKFYKEALSQATGQKEVFKVANRLFFKQKSLVLPSHVSLEELANRFSSFFSERIRTIRHSLRNSYDSRADQPSNDPSEISFPAFENFKSVTEVEIHKLVSRCPSKTCMLDPLPTWLLKENVDSLLPILTYMVNESLAEGVMPQQLKTGVVTPLIKKKNLDHELLKNYRPVSNLTFISKLIERIAATQFKDHMDSNGLHEVYQSAYRCFHSTETALVKVQNDILMGIDKDGASILILLDLSAAFDTIDHSVLLATLEGRFNVKGVVLKWFKSYISDRKQSVVIQGQMSLSSDLVLGYHKAQFWALCFFTAYTTPLGDIVRSFNLSMHLYADDTQIYVSFKPLDSASTSFTFAAVQECVDCIKIWMTTHWLKLNDDKTELIVFRPQRLRAKLDLPTFSIWHCEITPSSQVRNLGVVFDSSLCMEPHVNGVCRSAYFHIRNIGLIRRYLDEKTTSALVQAKDIPWMKRNGNQSS
ncbi:uncharacterized protein LOC124283847 [Haliotis rubra]|uniref:uncharacterized protein LOC124283847 n=1 Tax=Haliotis rubra TaxID=36100 RepID=UPI001EE63294|nr:uncharacterized protein LOC124283847 [Haliotis rubra]